MVGGHRQLNLFHLLRCTREICWKRDKSRVPEEWKTFAFRIIDFRIIDCMASHRFYNLMSHFIVNNCITSHR